MVGRTGTDRFASSTMGASRPDTNTDERRIRPIALSRKNALFVGSDRGAADWAIITSPLETVKLNDAYLIAGSAPP